MGCIYIYIGVILGICIYIYMYIVGLYWDNGEENGKYYSIIGYIYWAYFGMMEKKMETTV